MSVCQNQKSTHKAEVIRIDRVEKHPNADRLGVVQVWGYQCCVGLGEFKEGDLAVYIVPDSLVDVTRPEFTFLAEQAKADGKVRIKARKLRGVTSYGLLVPAPAGAQQGEDLAEQLGVSRYEPEEAEERGRFISGGEEERGPSIHTGPEKYDVDSFERYAHLVFEPGEPVAVMEKLDGSNCRFVYWDDRFWVKTRNRWVKRTPDVSHITVDYLVSRGCDEEKAREIVWRNVERVACGMPTHGFWEALEATPVLMEFLKANPGVTVFGEIYGRTNRIKYGFAEGNRIGVFDIYKDGRFLDVNDARSLGRDLPWVPSLTPFGLTEDRVETQGVPYDFETIRQLAEGPTLCFGAKPGVIREGVVVKPLRERWHRTVGRAQLKCVSAAFLEKF